MIIAICGKSHLAQTLERAAVIRGIEVEDRAVPVHAELIFVAHDVLDHTQLDAVAKLMERALKDADGVPVILVSQVPPGFTRPWANANVRLNNVFYQVDTIIMDQALDRMMSPEQYIIGCQDPTVPLPLAYQEYLSGPPILRMSYESAELAKLAINYFLYAQIETSHMLSDAAERLGADWDDVAAALRNDKRIGRYAYLRPGVANTHLMRDVNTITKLMEDYSGPRARPPEVPAESKA